MSVKIYLQGLNYCREHELGCFKSFIIIAYNLEILKLYNIKFNITNYDGEKVRFINLNVIQYINMISGESIFSCIKFAFNS